MIKVRKVKLCPGHDTLYASKICNFSSTYSLTSVLGGVSGNLPFPGLFKHADKAVGRRRTGDGVVHYVGVDDEEKRGIGSCRKSTPVASVVQPTVQSSHCLRHSH